MWRVARSPQKWPPWCAAREAATVATDQTSIAPAFNAIWPITIIAKLLLIRWKPPKTYPNRLLSDLIVVSALGDDRCGEVFRGVQLVNHIVGDPACQS